MAGFVFDREENIEGKRQTAGQNPTFEKDVKFGIVFDKSYICCFPFVYRRYRLPIWATLPEDG